jgi:DNA-binding transcriptional MerR regulator
MMAQDLSHKQFTAKDIHEILGIDKNRLFHWINTHRLLKPDIEEGSGRGKRRVFSRNNLLELALIIEWHHYGIDLKMISGFMGFIRSWRHKAKLEDGKWVRTEDKSEKNTRELTLYDWVFDGGKETTLKLWFNKRGIMTSSVIWEDRPDSADDKKAESKMFSYIVTNLTSIAKEITEKIEKM